MIEDFLQELQDKIDNRETGRLELIDLNRQGTAWSIYFALGRLMWSNGGEHSLRRLDRHLKQQIPKPQQQKIPRNSNSQNQKTLVADYNWLANLFSQGFIEINQLIEIKRKINIEVLFDIFQNFHCQRKASENNNFRWQWFPNVRPDNYIHIPTHLADNSKEVIKNAQQQWQKWKKAGLDSCFPNQAPIMTDAEKIKQETAAQTFKNLKQLLTGKQTLRDIAAKKNRDVLLVTQILWKYYQQGWLDFKELSDLDWGELTNTQPQSSSSNDGVPLNQGGYSSLSPSRASNNGDKKFLIACVDDSSQVTQTMENILHSGGYDCLSINDPLRASASLLKAKPNLIFLDLIMPTTNGYEICSQLRKVSSLQKIPIIILTGKDGLIDRMRARMVGSTEYISKPVKPDTILEVVQKYLPTTTEVNTENSTDLYSVEP